MARISVEELVAVIKGAPNYKVQWEMGVPAEQALYIRFGKSGQRSARSEVLVAANGAEIVLDLGPDGRVVGVEIV